MELLDRVFGEIWGWLAEEVPRQVTLIAFPLFVFALILVVSWTVRRFLPWVGSAIVLPLLIAAAALLGSAVLVLQVILAMPWRACGARPNTFVYTMGDLAVAGLSRLRQVGQSARLMLVRMRWLSRYYPLILVVLLVWRWNGTYCDRQPATQPCRSPYSTSSTSAVELWNAFLDSQSTQARR